MASCTDGASGNVGLSTSSSGRRLLKQCSSTISSRSAQAAREAARLQAMSRTPLTMLLARMKALLERLHLFELEAKAGRSSAAAVAAARKKVSMPCEPNSATAGGASALRYSREEVLDELQAMFSYSSTFLRERPLSTRLALAPRVRIESLKRDQPVFTLGEPGGSFYIVLSGAVELWVQAPDGSRPHITTLVARKGHVFGHHSLLTNEPRSKAATVVSDCTLLALEKQEFLDVLGDHFHQQQAGIREFLARQVALFTETPQLVLRDIAGLMLHTSCPAGATWDLSEESHIYVVVSGTCRLECLSAPAAQARCGHGRRNGQQSLHTSSASDAAACPSHTQTAPGAPSGRGGSASCMGPQAPRQRPSMAGTAVGDTQAAAGEQLEEQQGWQLANSGVLANVQMRCGRLMGTLGMRQEQDPLKRQGITCKAVALLQRGSTFGGGAAVIGEGGLQARLRVVAGSDVECYILPLGALLARGTPEMLRALRDSTAFQLTYCLGRAGFLQPGEVVGHPSASLAGSSRSGTRGWAVAPESGDGAAACGPAAPPPDGTAPTSPTSTSAQASQAVSQRTSRARPASAASALRGLSKPASSIPASTADAAAGTAASSPPGFSRRAAAKRDAPREHVPGSGVFGPGTTAAQRHVQELRHQQPQQSGDDSPAASCIPSTGGCSRPGRSGGGAAPCSGSDALGGDAMHMTAVDKYYALGSNCKSTPAAAALAPMLLSWNPEGLAPLAMKLDEVASRADAAGQTGLAELVSGASRSRPASAAAGAGGAPSRSRPASAAARARGTLQQQPALQAARADALARGADAGQLGQADDGVTHPMGEGTAAGEGQAPCTAQRLPWQAQPPLLPASAPTWGRRAGLLAAGVMWAQLGEGSHTPPLRSCLTYEEIMRQKARAKQ